MTDPGATMGPGVLARCGRGIHHQDATLHQTADMNHTDRHRMYTAPHVGLAFSSSFGPPGQSPECAAHQLPGLDLFRGMP